MITIRQETPADIPAVRTVNESAFDQPAEADAVDALRARGTYLLSLVAEEEDQLVGHIFFSPVTIKNEAESLEIAGLAPMAALPGYQKRGVGSLLVQAGLEELKRMGIPAVVVLGHPGYYPRFGFVPASRWNIRYIEDVSDEVFMALELQPGALTNHSGIAYYQPEFSGL
jgi:putative acetyltransferase